MTTLDPTGNNLSSFVDLPDELQMEALREGEERVRAQLDIATAADSRALAWGGLLMAAVTASIGAGLAVLTKDKPDYFLSLVALGLGVSLLHAAMIALGTVFPKDWHLPGNTPAHWLPEMWDCVGSDNKKAKQARLEQAQALTIAIRENSDCAKRRARKMHDSFELAKTSMLFAGLALFGALAFGFTNYLATQSSEGMGA